MDTTTLIVIVALVSIVGFFGFQWYQAAQKGKTGKKVPQFREAMAPMAPPAEDTKLKLPEVPGQTEQELVNPEPTQRKVPPTVQKPVGPEARSPPAFNDSLRRPEQSFQAPPPASVPQMAPDVAAGRAGPGGTSGNPPATHVQNFSPEMAQNGGPVVGSSVFAFDGAEPTGFASF